MEIKGFSLTSPSGSKEISGVFKCLKLPPNQMFSLKIINPAPISKILLLSFSKKGSLESKFIIPELINI